MGEPPLRVGALGLVEPGGLADRIGRQSEGGRRGTEEQATAGDEGERELLHGNLSVVECERHR